MNIHKLGRVTVVFDTSAKYQGTSLNENLLPGIDFLNNLVNVSTKFRTGKYAIIGDIDKMFHQVGVCESDMDALRFVRRENPEDKLLGLCNVSSSFWVGRFTLYSNVVNQKSC